MYQVKFTIDCLIRRGSPVDEIRRKELQELKLQNKKSEETILQIVNYQSLLEQYRDSLYVLDEAIPTSPELAKVIAEITKTATDSGLTINSLDVESIVLKGQRLSDGSVDINASEQTNTTSVPPDENNATGEEQNIDGAINDTKQPDLYNFTITINGSANLNTITQFLNQLLTQRRLKTFDALEINTDPLTDITRITIAIRTFYL